MSIRHSRRCLAAPLLLLGGTLLTLGIPTTRAAAQEAATPPPVKTTPPAVVAAEVFLPSGSGGGFSPYGTAPFRMDARRRISGEGTFPIAFALGQMMRLAGESFILGTEIQGTITLSFKDVPFETALKLILNASQPRLAYVREDSIYIFTPRSGSAATAAVDARRAALARQLDLLVEQRAQLALTYQPTSETVKRLDRQIDAVEAELKLRSKAM